MSDLDIVALVLQEHQAIRRTFSSLESIEGTDALAKEWRELADRLEVHASAEESMLYPKLLRVGDDDHAETDDAIRDHNDIRDTAHAVADHEVGTDAWWDAVRACQESNEHHLDEEERDVLPELKEKTDQAALDELGVQWLAFHEEHESAKGLSGEDKDPEAYIEQNT
jgi:iron-sulfur cluster repair protein YtfE (RIC family)